MFNHPEFIRFLANDKDESHNEVKIKNFKNSKKHKKYLIANFIKTNVLKYSDKFNNLSNFLELLEIEKDTYIDSAFILNINPELEDKVNHEIRDLEVEKIIDLNRVFFGVSIDTICYAVAIIDRFIAKVKVKPKYMACVTAACLQIAAEFKGHYSEFLESNYLSNLLRCGASATDLDRLRQIITTKLHDSMPRVTLYDFISAAMDYPRQTDNNNNTVHIDWTLTRIIETALANFRICNNRPSFVSMACLMLYYNEGQWVYLKYKLRWFKMDLGVIRQLSLEISEIQQQKMQQQHHHKLLSSSSSRHYLPWVLSRKTLTKIHTSLPPNLETIIEEEE